MYTSITSAYFFCLSLSMQTHNSIICSCGEWDLTILLFIPFLCCHRFSLQNQNKLHSNSFHHCNNLLCLSQHMALPVSSPMLFFFFIFFSIFPSNNNAEGPPSPGYYPSSRIASIPFNQAFSNLWGPQHQTLDQDTLTIWLDQTSGSGFKSLNPYSWGYFGAAIKLQPGYTAGVITCLYLSNNEEYPGMHDEIDIEFLGTTEDKPYVVQTNVYIKGSGDGDGNRNIIGREIKFHLWFDPTTDFHNYAILWNPNEIIFYVDDVPIRRYPRKSDETYPKRPMWVYGSIWDASSWATENGKYKADYSYQPFIGHYNNFKIHACTAPSTASCHRVSGYPSRSHGLSTQQTAALTYVHDNYKVYDYCEDPQRDHALTPECVT